MHAPAQVQFSFLYHHPLAVHSYLVGLQAGLLLLLLLIDCCQHWGQHQRCCCCCCCCQLLQLHLCQEPADIAAPAEKNITAQCILGKMSHAR
jgi:hypothetical protein